MYEYWILLDSWFHCNEGINLYAKTAEHGIKLEKSTFWNGSITMVKCHQILSAINNMSDKICILTDKLVNIELHVFAKTSESVYRCIIYWNSTSNDWAFEVNLVYSKQQISPVKRITLHRLEFITAIHLAKLITKEKSTLQLRMTEIYLWRSSKLSYSPDCEKNCKFKKYYWQTL